MTIRDRDLTLNVLRRHLQPTPFESSMIRTAEALADRMRPILEKATEYDDLIEQLQMGIPESWDGDSAGSAIVIDYVREIERRLIALGGTLERTAVVGTSTVADRRAEARASFDVRRGAESVWAVGIDEGLRDALTVATQVRVTPEAVGEVSRCVNRFGPNHGFDAGLSAALRKLGFEVVP